MRSVPGRADRVQEVRCQVGANVRRLRERRGFTQAQLAEVMGYEALTVQRLEAGTMARLVTVVAAADELEVPVAVLFRATKAQPRRRPGRPPRRPARR